MSSKKTKKLILLNASVALIDIALFSNALVGLSLFTGSVLSISIAWTAVIGSAFAVFKGNAQILNKPETRFLLQHINSLDSCVAVFEEAIHNGDVFDESILQNLDQIKRFRRKNDTIRNILLQKFSANEMSYQKFDGVLKDVEVAVYTNMRSILNKISAFDVEEYEAMQKKGGKDDRLSREKQAIYNEYIDFVSRATLTNEDVLLKLDRMLLEISRYNSLEDGDVQKLPALIEIDELIKNANLYK